MDIKVSYINNGEITVVERLKSICLALHRSVYFLGCHLNRVLDTYSELKNDSLLFVGYFSKQRIEKEIRLYCFEYEELGREKMLISGIKLDVLPSCPPLVFLHEQEKTVIQHILHFCDFIFREPKVLIRYFCKKLNTFAYWNDKQELCFLGRQNFQKIQMLLNEFIAKYQKCPKCHYHNTLIDTQQRKTVRLYCLRCKKNFPLINDDFTAFLYKFYDKLYSVYSHLNPHKFVDSYNGFESQLTW